ncbi:MAG: class I SAM-dependent methyltransferase [Planctomycetes bacterium]|nr:class I SAM-dependent methyltransferase [Planctomycetota bacterium]
MSNGPAQLYETLARYQWLRRRWGGAEPGAGLEIRKRLLPAATPPEDSGEALDRWLLQLAAVPDGGKVLDLGCGFGASLLRWTEWSGGQGLGVTASPFQVARANEEAVRRGLDGRCRFVVQDFTAPVADSFGAVFAIEALGHAPDLAAVLAGVHRCLAPGGRFVQVEDLLREPAAADDRCVSELSRCWSSPPLRDLATAKAALAAAGLDLVREIDLTERVAPAAPRLLDRRESRLRWWRAALPIAPWHRLADAFLGGSALERLYASGRACYRVFVCERTRPSKP